MRYLFLTLMLGLGLSFVANAQSNDVSQTVKEKMALLSWVEGTWTGETDVSRSGKELTQTVTVTEEARFEMDGMILTLRFSGERSGDEVSGTYATITYDVRKQDFVMRAMTDEGHLTDPAFHANNQGMQWRTKVGKGFVKYTVENVNGQWLETGYSSVDGETWEQIFSVTLKKR